MRPAKRDRVLFLSPQKVGSRAMSHVRLKDALTYGLPRTHCLMVMYRESIATCEESLQHLSRSDEFCQGLIRQPFASYEPPLDRWSHASHLELLKPSELMVHQLCYQHASRACVTHERDGRQGQCGSSDEPPWWKTTQRKGPSSSSIWRSSCTA